jgi:Ca2+-binding RTX toxin-like protein
MVANMTDANDGYVYVLKANGDPRLVFQSTIDGDFYRLLVASKLSILNFGLDSTPDNVFGGPRVGILEGDTIVISSPNGQDDQQILVDQLLVKATSTTTDLNLTLGTELPDGTPVSVQSVTLLDYATGLGANVDVKGNGLDNTIVGNSGDNTLRGEGGADQLTGGAGSDVLFVDADDTLVSGGAGYDYVHVTTSAPVTLDMTAAQVEWFGGNDGNDVADGTGSTVGLAQWGRGGDDELTGGDGGDIIIGGDGEDAIVGNDGADGLYGADLYNQTGDGEADSFDAGGGSDVMFIDATDAGANSGNILGGTGYDYVVVWDDDATTLTLTGANGIEWVGGGNEADTFDASAMTTGMTMLGGGGIDTLIGGTGGDSLYGDAGADRLVGGNGPGVDSLFGGADNDTFAYTAASSGLDYIYDWNAGDKIEVAGLTSGDVSISQPYGPAYGTYISFGAQTVIVLGQTVTIGDFLFV